MRITYTRLEVSRSQVRDEVLEYLRKNRDRLRLSEPDATCTGYLREPARDWFQRTNEKTGILVNEVVNAIYQRLDDSGKAKATPVSVADSTVAAAYDAYFPLHIKTIILEEVLNLVRLGVLIQVGFRPQHPGINYDFEFDLTASRVMLTERGVDFLAEELPNPCFPEKYFDRLRQLAEPDDELKSYLGEGLACLQNHLARAAAILLRLAAEHILDILIQSTLAVLNTHEANNLQRNINKARMNIEERAEVIFRKLESAQALVPYTDAVTNRLRPAFHSIRELGGRAAHSSAVIRLDEVADHYTLYASSVYTLVMEIIQHQRKMQGTQR